MTAAAPGMADPARRSWEDAGEPRGGRAREGGDAPAPSATCPHCGSTDGVLESAFGGSLMTRQIYCRGCRTVFEQVKWDDDPSPGDWLGRP